MPRAVFVQGMKGLGDNIFERAFVKTLVQRADVWLTTPWPELFADLDRVRFVHQPTPLRTQSKNLARQDAHRWSAAPAGALTVRVFYGGAHLRSGSIVRAMEQQFGCAPSAFDLPTFPAPPANGKPIALVRPVTERREWFNAARNPLPEHVAYVAAELLRDYHVVSVADLEPEVEWLVGDPPPAHERFHAGELGVAELLGYLRAARVVVGGVGWIVPAAIAAGVPLFCILGGQGGHNAPERITDPRMDLSHAGFAHPDNFCLCENMRHECDKRNRRLAEQWDAFRRRQGL
jgi:hypothetical protein